MVLLEAATASFKLLFSTHKPCLSHHSRHNAMALEKTTYITVVANKDDTGVAKCISSSSTPVSRRRQSSPALFVPHLRRKKRLVRLSSLLQNTRRISLSCLAHPVLHTKASATCHTTVCHLQELPSELIQRIVQYLDYCSILTLSRVSKYFHCFCSPSHNSLWLTLFTIHFAQNAPAIPVYPVKTAFYQRLYHNHYILEQRWKRGDAQVRYLSGHTDSVYCIARFGRYLISGSRDHSIKLWNLDSEHAHQPCIATRTEHSGSVLCLQVSKQEQWMVSGSSDGTCVIWHLPRLDVISRLYGHSHGVLDVCIVEDTWIVSASRDTTVRVWDHATGKELWRLIGHDGPVNALQSHGKHVVSAAGDATVKLWDVESGQCLRTFLGHTRGLACVQFDGQRIFSGGQDTTLKIWDAHTGECKATLTGHRELIRAIDSCGDTIITGSYDRTLKIWNASTGECVLSFQKCHESWIFNALVSHTGIISAGQDKRIMVLDFAYGLDSLMVQHLYDSET